MPIVVLLHYCGALPPSWRTVYELNYTRMSVCLSVCRSSHVVKL